jgi:putative membrane protein
MVMHILLMNLLAPATAFFLCAAQERRREPSATALALVTMAQLGGLWIWHAPPLLGRAFASDLLLLLMHSTLFLGALLFWWLVFRFEGNHSWKPVLALLVTSKFYCLLAVLFVFAPRALYGELAGHHTSIGVPALTVSLADQQLAGLIMLAACPATYIVAGIAVAARWLFALEAVSVDQSNADAEAWR